MPIQDLIPDIYSRLFIGNIVQVSPLRALAQDRSSEIRAMGGKLIVPVSAGLVQVGDYPESDDITYGDLDPGKVELTVDKEKYIAFKLEDIDDAQIAVDLWGEAIRESAVEFASQLADDMRAIFANANVSAARNETVVIASGAATTAAERQALHLAVYNLVSRMRIQGYRQTPFVIVPPPVHKMLTQYITVDKPQVSTARAAAAFADASLSSIYGAEIVPDWGGDPVLDTAADTIIWAGIRNRTLGYAEQVSRTETLRSEGRFARLWRSLVTYGAGVQENKSLHSITLDVTAN